MSGPLSLSDSRQRARLALEGDGSPRILIPMSATTFPRIPSNVRPMVAEQANAFYEGDVSSVEAFQVINTVARSAWNYYDGIFSDTHALFAELVDERIDADVDSWATA